MPARARFCGDALLYGVYRGEDSFVEEMNRDALEVMRAWKDIRNSGKFKIR